MPDRSTLDVLWTDESLKNAVSIKQYLLQKFSEKELDLFYLQLLNFTELIVVFPKLYPLTNKGTKIRRAVLSKEFSVFYRIKRKHIEILALIDNRADLSSWY